MSTNYYLTSDGKFVSEDELYHYGVPGMKWGRRKAYDPTSYGGSITKTGKYKASNGVVIAKSKNAGVAIGRRLSTTAAGRALSAVGSVAANKNTKNRIKKERAALKEYYKVGGDKMLGSHNNGSTSTKGRSVSKNTKTSQINAKHATTGKAKVDRILNDVADLGAAGGVIGVVAKKKGYGNR